MRRGTALRLVALASLACAGPVAAHHSYLAYQTTAFWISGSVVGFEYVNPHTIVALESRSEDGRVRQWKVEGPSRAELDRKGTYDLPKIGETLEFCAIPYRPLDELARIWPGADFSGARWAQTVAGASPQLVAGRVMVMPDGRKLSWEPHGLLSECVRSSNEPRQSWLRFLDSNADVREDFCAQRHSQQVQSNASLRDFADELNSSIAEPCK